MSLQKKNVSLIIYFKKINLYLLIIKPINYIFFFNLINIDLFFIFYFLFPTQFHYWLY